MNIKHIHFVGIKGVGMTALAIIAKEAGVMVSGSDVSEQFITDISLQQAGIVPYVDFSSDHVNDCQLVVVTGAHGGYENVEVTSAKEKGIRVVSMAEAVGLIMDGELFGRKLKGISVTGTHGKTTTTAMVATVLKENNMDPSYLVGTSHIPSLGVSGHYGKGEYFVAEADEYATEPTHDRRPKFFWHHPKIAVITNIEHDHPDIYPDLESVKGVFRDFLYALPTDVVVIINGDDHGIQSILKSYGRRKISYGFNPNNDVYIKQFYTSLDKTFFSVHAFGTDLGEFILGVPGEHNCLNATAAVIVCLEAGLSIKAIKTGLKSFIGTKRRLELLGTLSSGALVYDDYGHHPTEIKITLKTLRLMYPKKQIICFFQPHTYSRTKTLFNDFIRSFHDVNSVIFLPIFASARENPDPTISSEQLANDAKKLYKDVLFLPTLTDVVKYLDVKNPGKDTVIITMGAGDVYKVAEQLKFEARNPSFDSRSGRPEPVERAKSETNTGDQK